MKAAGRNTDISTSVMPMIGPNSSFMAWIAASFARQAPLDVMRRTFDHHDGIVDDDADRQHDREQRRQVDGEVERGHRRQTRR